MTLRELVSDIDGCLEMYERFVMSAQNNSPGAEVFVMRQIGPMAALLGDIKTGLQAEPELGEKLAAKVNGPTIG